MDTSVLNETPEMIHNIPQPDFEQILTEELQESDLVEVRKNVSFCSCVEKSGGSVYTTVEERASGQTYTIRSDYLIAADGARSYVREYLKIKSTGEDTPETMMTIHFHADLRPVCGAHIGMLHWVMDPIVSGFIIGYDLSGNQVLICNFDPDKFPVDKWDESRCLAILRAAVGDDLAVKVQSWRPWIFKRKIAEQYRVGNVFLVGDAAHSFPPTGGLGLNSGLADVHNLAYKIAAVLQGWADNSILDTYQAERRHVAEINSQQSVKNGKKIFGLLKALGTTNSDVGRARRDLHVSLRDVEKRKRLDREIEEQQEHFDNVSKPSILFFSAAAITKRPTEILEQRADHKTS
jgi:2-polyprenyl-6-methoxyphenol hydroxylase-like FAD-dependent oxidoreductase